MRYKENEAEKEESQYGQDYFAAGHDCSIHRSLLRKAGQTSSEQPRMAWGREEEFIPGSTWSKACPPASSGCAFQSMGTSWVPQWCQHRSPGGR